jgi:hypothetical protein
MEFISRENRIIPEHNILCRVLCIDFDIIITQITTPSFSSTISTAWEKEKRKDK